jgi:hypothetical protein
MITIPPLPPSELHGCNIIDIQYNVIVSTVIDCILYTMITIPPLPPSELHGCNIIDLQYNVIVSTVIEKTERGRNWHDSKQPYYGTYNYIVLYINNITTM